MSRHDNATCRRIPQDPATLATLGLAAWDVVPLIVLGNAGVAAFWTGDPVEAEKHLQAAVDYNRSSGLLRPQLNAAAYLALLRCERGDLDAAHDEAQAVVEQATDAGWTVSAQVVAAYLTLAWVALDRDDHPDADGWFARIAEVEAVAAAVSDLLVLGRRGRHAAAALRLTGELTSAVRICMHPSTTIDPNGGRIRG